MTSFTRMRWTGVDPRSAPHDLHSQWTRLHDLLGALERERVALESTRRGFAQDSPSDAASLDPEALHRERRLARRVANLKWMCVGGGLCWLFFVLLSI